MTICLAIRCKKSEKKAKGPVLLFASDTQESSIYLKRSVTKMRVILGRTPKKLDKTWGILVASSGDAMVIDEVTSDIEDFLSKEIDPDCKSPSTKLASLRKKIGDIAYDAYGKYRERKSSNPLFSLLLGAADESSTILHVTYEGKQQVLPQFGIIGSGPVTGGELLLREFIREDINQTDAAILAALIITRVGNVDISVGGEPKMNWCRNRRVWHYKGPTYKDILDDSRLRWNRIKNAWWKMYQD